MLTLMQKRKNSGPTLLWHDEHANENARTRNATNANDSVNKSSANLTKTVTRTKT